MDCQGQLESLIEWDYGVDVTGDGFCYLQLIRLNSRRTAAALLGSWPTVASLMAVGLDLFDTSRLSVAEYLECDYGYHVVVSGAGGGNSFLLKVLRPAARGFSWPSGSLGDWCSSGPSIGGSVRILSARVGGFQNLVRPAADDRQGCLEYNRAMAEHNRVVAVAELAKQGLSVAAIERLVRAVVTTEGQVPLASGGVEVPADHVRGPNWERNRAAKAVQRVRRQEDRERYVAAQAVKSFKEKAQTGNPVCRCGLAGAKVQNGQGSNGSGSAKVLVRSPEEEELHKLRVERQIIQEKRKLEKLKSPTQIIEDAMRMVDFAQKCAKQQNDSKVAAWAAALSQASAESIAKSGSMPSVESLSSAKVKTVSSESSVSGGVPQKQGDSASGDVPSSGQFRFESTAGSRAAARSTGYKEFVEGKESRVVVEDVDGSPLVLNKVPASKIVGSLAAGTAVTTEGRSIDSNGVAYTKATALAWVRRYDSCIRRHASITKSDEQIAKDAGLSLAEVKKYYRLRKEFGL